MQGVFRSVLVSTLAVAIACLGMAIPTRACPFCTPSIPLSEELAQAHVALGVKWLSGRPGDVRQGEPGSTRVQVTHQLKEEPSEFANGQLLDLPTFYFANPGESLLLLGHLREGEVLQWSPLRIASQTLLEYASQRPSGTIPLGDRLPFYVGYLEHPDELIAQDAYSEFSNAAYSMVEPLADRLDRKQLLDWIINRDATYERSQRVAFYGMLLGLCGTRQDAQVLYDIITEPTDEFRIGTEGIMAGYMMLTGEEGLAKLQEYAFGPDAPPNEAFVLQQAVRFLYEYGPFDISRENLRASMRRLLDDPQLAEFALTDLTRWDDLAIVDTLIEKYNQPGYDHRGFQTAVVTYYQIISELPPEGRSEGDQQSIRRAAEHLATLRQQDPEIFESGLIRASPAGS